MKIALFALPLIIIKGCGAGGTALNSEDLVDSRQPLSDQGR